MTEMRSEYRRGSVFVQNRYCGIISENDNGYLFQYDSEYLKSSNPVPVSLTLPLSDQPYLSNTLFPFFDGLIPEGWLLDVVSRNWKLQRNDRFGILLAACRDCIGDVSIRPEAER